MLGGLIVAGVLGLALFALYLFNTRPKVVSIDNLPPLSLKVPMPPVKPTREEKTNAFQSAYAERPITMHIPKPRPATPTAYSYETRQRSFDDYIEPEDTGSALGGIVAAAAAIVVADAVYDNFIAPAIDTTPAYEYSSPTPSDYSDSSSSSSDTSSSWSD